MNMAARFVPVPPRRTENSFSRNPSRLVLDSSLTKGANGRPRLEEQATNLLLKELREIPTDRIRQAVRLATLLASSPPNSRTYYQRAVPDIVANFDGKLLAWLTGEACRRLGADSNLRLADLSEDLKRLAAWHELPYSGGLVNDAIDASLRRLEQERQLRSELTVGRGPAREHGESHYECVDH
jgi:hypothetical protein